MHRTLGGLQFGARYFIDFVPYLAFYLANTKIKSKLAIPVLSLICVFALLLNVYGAYSLMK